MARAELGTKRVCPETGKKFYDLNKDPIVSPFTGKEYPRSYFEETAPATVEKEAASAKKGKVEKEQQPEEETETEEEDGPEFVSLEEADEDSDDNEDEEIPDLPDVEIEDDDDEDAAFLEEEEEEDDDLSDVINGVEGEDET